MQPWAAQAVLNGAEELMRTLWRIAYVDSDSSLNWKWGPQQERHVGQHTLTGQI